MQSDHSLNEKQSMRGGEAFRRQARIVLDTARRSKGLLLVAAAVFACSACASLPPSGANAGDASTCTGPVSYCNIFFGS
jgi:hypothetical protein